VAPCNVHGTAVETSESRAIDPAFLLCNDLQSHQLRANRSLPH